MHKPVTLAQREQGQEYPWDLLPPTQLRKCEDKLQEETLPQRKRQRVERRTLETLFWLLHAHAGTGKEPKLWIKNKCFLNTETVVSVLTDLTHRKPTNSKYSESGAVSDDGKIGRREQEA